MLNNHNSISFSHDLLAVYGRRVYAHLQDLSSDSVSAERLTPPADLEYVFQLIRSSFLYIDGRENNLIPQQIEDKTLYPLLFFVLSLPFKDESNNAQVEQWNELVGRVSNDFAERKDKALRGLCTYEQLEFLVRDQIENFEYEDRMRLDSRKLINLILFVYDYSMLTMREARLYQNLDVYVDGLITIRKKRLFVPLRICASINQYEPYSYEPIEGVEWPIENYKLPRCELVPIVRNPHASDSNCAAMFADLMHKFFLSFGLQKKGRSDWAKAERMLVYELLRLFGLCKSNLPAEKSKYVTTVLNDYGDYFFDCNLRTWIREDQSYYYLMCCSVDDLLRNDRQMSEPFISLENNYVFGEAFVSGEKNAALKENTINSGAKNHGTSISLEELSKDIKESMEELVGKEQKVKITHTEYGLIRFASIIRENSDEKNALSVDPRLEYVMSLIGSAFEYITFLPVLGQYLVVRNDINSAIIGSRLIASLEKDLLDRVDSIPRNNFDGDKAKGIIKYFYEKRLDKAERAMFDVEKFYILFLFIYDYVYLTYKEATISPHLKKFIKSKLIIGSSPYQSTVLIDDMLMAYLEAPFTIVSSGVGKTFEEVLKAPNLYVPSPEKNYPIELDSCNVKNMIAMFYDLFVYFFRSFGLSRRSDVKFLSDQESILVAELAKCCGICETDNANSVRAMFMSNQDYFEKSSLQLLIRENEYHSLMMNKMSTVLFGPKSPTE